jgi:hypothetical protein
LYLPHEFFGARAPARVLGIIYGRYFPGLRGSTCVKQISRKDPKREEAKKMRNFLFFRFFFENG